jgi:hypothetical protein
MLIQLVNTCSPTYHHYYAVYNQERAEEGQDDEGWMDDVDAARALSSTTEGAKWPVLSEMEGGRDVQLMQVRIFQ